MKTTFTPKCCQGEDATYIGTVTMRYPSYDERLEMFADAGVDVIGDPESVERITETQYMIKFMKALPKFVEAIDIVRVDDGFKFDSYDKLKYESGASRILFEMVGVITRKHRVSGDGSDFSQPS